jgi:predicted permease
MEIRVATPEYFSTIGIPLVRGRLFSDADRPGSTPVVLITAAAARRFFPGEDPIGKTITLGWGKRVNGGRTAAGGQVVGIVGDVKDAGLGEANAPELYLPFRQWPIENMTVLVRTATPPASLADAIRAQVASLDPGLPVSNIRTLDDIVAKSISQPRFYMTLLTIFAAVALALAAIGIFGVLTYAVSQRTREIGIRMALGAREGSVVALVVSQAMGLVIIGLIIGLAAAALLAHTLTGMLFSVTPTDPLTFAAVGALLSAVALFATYVPARRASRVDPTIALRAD